MLINKIEKLLSNSGSITVADFTREVISYYYQNNDPFGKEGDFTTAPEISQIFGELVGIWFASMWQNMGSPIEVNFVEIGPGKGTLTNDILRATKNVSGFHEAINVYMVETSDRLTQIQKQTLENSHNNISWCKSIEDIPEGKMLIVGNEFFDALPINQYQKTQDGWCERIIKKSDAGLEFAISKPLTFSAEIDTKHPNAPMGAILEVCQASNSIVKYLASAIVKNGGAALFIDYGYTQYSYKDSLQAVKDHKYHPVLKDIGQADLTSLVDFTALLGVAKGQKANVFDIMTQGEFLLSMGVEIRKNALMKNASKAQAKDIEDSVARLTDEDKMGKLFKVLAFSS